MTIAIPHRDSYHSNMPSMVQFFCFLSVFWCLFGFFWGGGGGGGGGGWIICIHCMQIHFNKSKCAILYKFVLINFQIIMSMTWVGTFFYILIIGSYMYVFVKRRPRCVNGAFTIQNESLFSHSCHRLAFLSFSECALFSVTSLSLLSITQ